MSSATRAGAVPSSAGAVQGRRRRQGRKAPVDVSDGSRWPRGREPAIVVALADILVGRDA